MTDSEIQKLMEFHKIKTFSDFLAFKARYELTVMLQMSPNERDILKAALRDYEPEPWESRSVQKLLERLKNG